MQTCRPHNSYHTDMFTPGRGDSGAFSLLRFRFMQSGGGTSFSTTFHPCNCELCSAVHVLCKVTNSLDVPMITSAYGVFLSWSLTLLNSQLRRSQADKEVTIHRLHPTPKMSGRQPLYTHDKTHDTCSCPHKLCSSVDEPLDLSYNSTMYASIMSHHRPSQVCLNIVRTNPDVEVTLVTGSHS